VTQFTDLGIAEPILRAITHEGYTKPTPIQAQAIPPLLQNRDLLGIAQTGTGKTAAFAIPILNRIAADKRRPNPKTARALILAPTRELALQIATSFRAYGRFLGIKVGIVIGGVSPGPQVQALAGGLDVLVATPGRLLDHVSTGAVRLNETEVLVLDEADHMLDLGFVVPIRKILTKLPKVRQSLFFSATMPREIAGLAQEILSNPVEVRVAPVAATADRVAQEVFLVEHGGKPNLLIELLRRPGFSRSIVFTRTKRGADRVAKHVEAGGVTAAAIHGNKSQNQRQRALDDFKKGKIAVLVATDIAARGIDIDAVSHVVNFDLPEVPEAYVHRIGRTARAGLEGIAISLCAPDERALLKAIEKLTRQTLPLVDRRGEAAKAALPSGVAPPIQRGARENNQNKPFHQGRQAPRGAGAARPAAGGAGRPADQRPNRRSTRRPFPGGGETARA
jgi:ATP-dependent RNA helicase RhlE